MELIDIRFESFKELSYLIIAMPNSRTNKWTHYIPMQNLFQGYVYKHIPSSLVGC